jgi:Zincin-like metallopeptidase
VLSEVDRLTTRVGDPLASVEFGTEDVPQLSDEWTGPAPLGSLVAARPGTPSRPGTPTRIVVFRRPVEMRAKTTTERSLLVHAELLEHVAAFLGCDPADIDE